MNPLVSSFLNVSAKGVAGGDAVNTQQTTQQTSATGEFKSALEQARSAQGKSESATVNSGAADGGNSSANNSQASSDVRAAAQGMNGKLPVESDAMDSASDVLATEIHADPEIHLADAQALESSADNVATIAIPGSEILIAEAVTTVESAAFPLAGESSANSGLNLQITVSTSTPLTTQTTALEGALADAGQSVQITGMQNIDNTRFIQTHNTLTAQLPDSELVKHAGDALTIQSGAVATGILGKAGKNAHSFAASNSNASTLSLEIPGVKNLANSVSADPLAAAETAAAKPVADALVQIAGVSELAKRFNLDPQASIKMSTVLENTTKLTSESALLTTVLNEKVATETAASPAQLSFSMNHTAENPRMHLQMPVNISFGRPEWAGQVAERAALMSLQKIQVAELQLDPPDLGSLHVKVSVNADQQASVTFISPHASVRDALDQSVLRLRELLEQQGLDLVDVNVSDQQQEADDQEDMPGGTFDDNELTESQSTDELQTATVNISGHYGVDFYA